MVDRIVERFEHLNVILFGAVVWLYGATGWLPGWKSISDRSDPLP